MGGFFFEDDVWLDYLWIFVVVLYVVEMDESDWKKDGADAGENDETVEKAGGTTASQIWGWRVSLQCIWYDCHCSERSCFGS